MHCRTATSIFSSLADWLLGNTFAAIKKRWPKYNRQSDELIKDSFAKEIKKYDQVYFGVSWWSFTGFFKKLFLLLFWLSQQNKKRYLARLMWATFIKENLIKFLVESVGVEGDRISWASIIDQKFLTAIEAFASLNSVDHITSRKRKHITALHVLDYIAATGSYQSNQPVDLKIIREALFDLSLFLQASNKEFQTYTVIAIVNLQLFLQGLVIQKMSEKDWLASFFSEEIMHGDDVPRCWAHGRNLYKKHVSDYNYDDIGASFLPVIDEKDLKLIKRKLYSIGCLGIEEKEIDGSSLSKLRISTAAINTAWRKYAFLFHTDKLQDKTAQNLSIYREQYDLAREGHESLIESLTSDKENLLIPISRELYEHGLKQDYYAGKKHYVLSLELSRRVKESEEKDKKLEEKDEELKRAQLTIETQQKELEQYKKAEVLRRRHEQKFFRPESPPTNTVMTPLLPETTNSLTSSEL